MNRPSVRQAGRPAGSIFSQFIYTKSNYFGVGLANTTGQECSGGRLGRSLVYMLGQGTVAVGVGQGRAG